MKFNPKLSEGKRFILLALHAARSDTQNQTLLALYKKLGDKTCVELVRRHQVEAAVSTALLDVVPKKELGASWAEFKKRNQRRVEALIDALGQVCQNLDAAGVACATMEAGGVMLATSLPDAAFGSGDIDLLVEAGKENEVDAAFAAEGFEKTKRDGRRKTIRQEYYRRLDADTVLYLDAGTVAFERYWVPFDVALYPEDWLLHRVPSAKDARIPVLNPTDLLLQVAVHTSTHSYVLPPGPRLQLDVDRVARDLNIDWERFVDDVKKSGGQRRIFYSLAMAAELMGTPIPDDILMVLEPPDWQQRALWILIGGTYKSKNPARLSQAPKIALDRLIDGRSVSKWARSIFLPNQEWMRNFFEDYNSKSLLQLHIKRWKAMIKKIKVQK